jgi:hypothetical protein
MVFLFQPGQHVELVLYNVQSSSRGNRIVLNNNNVYNNQK